MCIKKVLRTIFYRQNQVKNKTMIKGQNLTSGTFLFINMPRSGKLFEPRIQVLNFVAHSHTFI